MEDERQHQNWTEAFLEDLLISGRAVAEEIDAASAASVMALQARAILPTLAVVHCGDHPDAARYRRATAQSAKRAGVTLHTIAIGEDNPAAALRDVLAQLNNDPSVHGVMVQNPLPFSLRQLVGNLLSADKDVEGLTALNLGRLALDEPAVVPCTPAAVLALIEHQVPNVHGKRVVVVNGSTTIGRPLCQILLARQATVTVCGIATADLPAETRRAEILVVAIGQPRAIGADYVGDGALVIDVGINIDPNGNGVCGDVDTDAVLDKVSGITPVPGGVGPVTTAMLIANTVLLAERHGSAVASDIQPWVGGAGFEQGAGSAPARASRG
ncbi:MAG TPA: bifunctional 5,10-methylenetetrahydrofolate dehydrogenase/5,10-methenyltetrahydrofolate cyclohydrolase [Chloroflexota bacterium]|nr:bifunctional 5,10-methylenetetrahydrofolate dehydrogenase/5,10-methenyltetrahydrofolate cyclohydrolase [Chloroflexota bacterium]